MKFFPSGRRNMLRRKVRRFSRCCRDGGIRAVRHPDGDPGGVRRGVTIAGAERLMMIDKISLIKRSAVVQASHQSTEGVVDLSQPTGSRHLQDPRILRQHGGGPGELAANLSEFGMPRSRRKLARGRPRHRRR